MGGFNGFPQGVVSASGLLVNRTNEMWETPTGISRDYFQTHLKERM